MTKKYYLAVDIGASSGRHMLAHMEDGRMVLEEIHRFPNAIVEKNGQKTWDTEKIFKEILTGMKKCKEQGKIPYSVGIDTWAVDFVLLDKEDQPLGNAVSYRDGRTNGMDDYVYKVIPESSLYQATGIQKQIFNTIYQLMALKKKEPALLEKAASFLMIPDYFHFLLTGKKVQEYTNATTTQLVDPVTKNWNYKIIEALGYPLHIFQEIHQAGYELGNLKENICREIGFDCKIVLPPTHDTACAVLAVPAKTDTPLYISSGTWSLMGTELLKADCSSKSMQHNLTNEGGYDYRFRYLKNIMGLWMIQSVRREIAPEMDFGEICKIASQCSISSLVDVNSSRFLAPENMTAEIKKTCRETGQQIPQDIAQIAAVIYNSLAECYKTVAEEIEKLTRKHYNCIYIVGGGANADYLNQLTAAATKKPIYAGPTEATAIGNLAAQMIATGELKDLKYARNCIRKSFPVKQYL